MTGCVVFLELHRLRSRELEARLLLFGFLLQTPAHASANPALLAPSLVAMGRREQRAKLCRQACYSSFVRFQSPQRRAQQDGDWLISTEPLARTTQGLSVHAWPQVSTHSSLA